MAATVIYENREPVSIQSEAADGELWVTLDELADLADWELKPEGVCRESICIPIPDGERDRFVRHFGDGDRLNLAEFARLIEQPVAHDDSGTTWYFGAPSWEWQDRLTSQIAPDFALPDFQGVMHRLTDYRGKKVFLLCWASW